jgi:integrase
MTRFDLAPVAPAAVTIPEEIAAVGALLQAGRATGTRRAYASSMRTWSRWCETRGVDPLPADPSQLAVWIAELVAAGRASSTIDGHLAALRAASLDAGLDDPTSHPGVRQVRAGVRRTVGTAPRRRVHAVTTAEIRRIIEGIDVVSLRGLRDRALILTGYAAALRRSELTGLDIDDLAWRRDGVVLTIRRAKGDQEGRGATVGVVRGRHSTTDPVTALRAWIAAAGLGSGDPLWTPIAWSDRRPVPRRLDAATAGVILRERAAAVGLTSLDLTIHSLRAGHATTAAEAGIDTARIARHTRHRSIETLAGYLRPAKVLDDTTSGFLGL